MAETYNNIVKTKKHPIAGVLFYQCLIPTVTHTAYNLLRFDKDLPWYVYITTYNIKSQAFCKKTLDKNEGL